MSYPSWLDLPDWVERPELHFQSAHWLDVQPHDVILWEVNEMVCECIVVELGIDGDTVRGKLMVRQNAFVYFRCPLNRLPEVASAVR